MEFTGALKAVQQANYQHGKTLDPGTGEETGGILPWDQQVAIYTQNGGQGGAAGLVNDMNTQGKPYHMSAQDFGASWETLMPGLAAYYRANPTLMPETTPNTQNLADVVLNNAASRFVDSNGNFTADKATFDPIMQAEIKKYNLGAGSRSIGSLAKSFVTEGALPFIAKAAAAGGGLESLLGTSGTLAGDAFLPGALGADGAGAGLPLASGADATWGANPRPDMSLLDADPGGMVNPATGQVGPGLPGGTPYAGSSLMDSVTNDGNLASNAGSGKAIPQSSAWKDYFDAASHNLSATMPTTGNKLVDNLLTKAATTALGSANSASAGVGGDTTAADQQAAEEARKQSLIEQINQMYSSDNFRDEEDALSGAIRGQQGDALKLGYDNAARSTTFDAARRGNVGGSVMADNIAGLNRDNQLGATKIEDAVSSALSGLRSSRLSSQGNAISLVNAGSGPEAVDAAASGIRNAIDTARASKVPDVTQGLFQNVALSNQGINTGNNTAALGAYINARNTGGGSLFPLGSGASGRNVAV